MAADGSPSTLDRAEAVFAALSEHGFLTLTEITAVTGIPRSSAHRLLTRMVRLRWLLRVGDNYELGVRMFELGTPGRRNHWFHRIAYPRLQELHARTGFVVHMAYLDGWDAMYWERLGTGRFGAELPTRVGTQWPAHRTALGKVLLADESDADLARTAPATLTPGTAATITDFEVLRRQLDRVRADLIAFDRGEALAGVGCVAAAAHAGRARTSDGHSTTVAISVTAPLDQFDRRWTGLVLATAAEITRAAGPNPMAE